MNKAIALENNRIILSLFSEEEFNEVFSIMNTREVLDTMVLNYPMNRESMFRNCINSPLKAVNGEEYNYIIRQKNNERILGMCDLLDVNKIRKNAELGYWIDPAYRRQGIIFDACTILLNYAFTRLAFHKIWAETFFTNNASRGLLKKLGFREVGIQKKEVFKHGQWQDRVRYELLSHIK